MINLVFLLFILSFIWAIYHLSAYNTWATSPILEHQGIPNTSKEPKLSTNDLTNHITLHNGRTIFFESSTNMTDCRIDQIPRLSSVSYLSNGRILNSTFWLSSPPLNASYPEYPFVNVTAIDQAILVVEVSHYKEKRSLQELIRQENKTFLENEGSDKLKLINVTHTKVNNNSAYKLIFTGKTQSIFGNSPITIMDIITIKDNKVYRIIYGQEYDRFPNVLQTIQKMVDSFQILDNKELRSASLEHDYHISSSYNQPEQLDTYINDALGIKMSYPQTWGHTIFKNNESSRVMFFSPIRGPYLLLYDYIIAFDIPSFIYDQTVDYVAKMLWIDDINDPTFSNNSANTVSWGRIVQEFSGYADPRVMSKIPDNGKSFGKGENYVLLPVDLSIINYPSQYAMIFGTEISFVKDGINCNLIDSTNPVASPTPIISILPQINLTSIGPNEEKIIELRIKSSSNIPTSISLGISSNNLVNGRIIPDKLNISSAGWASTYLFLKTKFGWDSMFRPSSIPITLPITANIGFPKDVTHFSSGTEEYLRDKGFEILKPNIASVTVSLMNLYEYIFHYLSSLSVLVPLAGVVGGTIAWLLKTWVGKREE